MNYLIQVCKYLFLSCFEIWAAESSIFQVNRSKILKTSKPRWMRKNNVKMRTNLKYTIMGIQIHHIWINIISQAWHAHGIRWIPKNSQHLQFNIHQGYTPEHSCNGKITCITNNWYCWEKHIQKPSSENQENYSINCRHTLCKLLTPQNLLRKARQNYIQ